jgi:hypothetical protein
MSVANARDESGLPCTVRRCKQICTPLLENIAGMTTSNNVHACMIVFQNRFQFCAASRLDPVLGNESCRFLHTTEQKKTIKYDNLMHTTSNVVLVHNSIMFHV